MTRTILLPALLVVLLVAGSAFHLNDSTEVPSSADPMGIHAFVAWENEQYYLLKPDGTRVSDQGYNLIRNPYRWSRGVHFAAFPALRGGRWYLLGLDGVEVPGISAPEMYAYSGYIILAYNKRDHAVYRHDLSLVGRIECDLVLPTQRLSPEDPRKFWFIDGGTCGCLSDSLDVLFSVRGEGLDLLPNGNSLVRVEVVPRLAESSVYKWQLVDGSGRVLYKFTCDHPLYRKLRFGPRDHQFSYVVKAEIGPDLSVIFDDTGRELFRGNLGVYDPFTDSDLFKVVEDGVLYLTDFCVRRFEIGPVDGRKGASVGEFAGGLCPFTQDGELWGYLDEQGSVSITPQFSKPPRSNAPGAKCLALPAPQFPETPGFSHAIGEGLAIVLDMQGKHLLIDKVGNNVAAYGYERLEWYEASEFIAFEREGRRGFLNSKGTEVFAADIGSSLGMTWPVSGRSFVVTSEGSFVVDIPTGERKSLGNLKLNYLSHIKAPGWPVTDGERTGFVNLNGEFLVGLRWGGVYPAVFAPEGNRN